MRRSPPSFPRASSTIGVILVALVISVGGSVFRALASLASVGQPAPQFTGTDSQGRMISLGDYRGRVVVLEWTNHECPFVRRHYDSGNMQALEKQAVEHGVVWLSVISSAPGEQGYVTGHEAMELSKESGAVPTAVILAPDGRIGRAYDAKTTPHMFVIDGSGTLVYAGAIDDQPRNFRADPARATNFVALALLAVRG